MFERTHSEPVPFGADHKGITWTERTDLVINQGAVVSSIRHLIRRDGIGVCNRPSRPDLWSEDENTPAPQMGRPYIEGTDDRVKVSNAVDKVIPLRK